MEKNSQGKKATIIRTNVKKFVDMATYRQRVEQKAYEIYLKRGGKPGDAMADWTEAEKIISKELGI